MARTTLPDSVSTHLSARTAQVSVQLVRDEWLVVTPDDLIVVGEDGIRLDLPWIAVESASWDGDSRSFALNLVDGQCAIVQTSGDDVWLMTVAVREHVNSSIVHVEYLETSAGGEVRALIRTNSQGDLSSQLIARGPVSDDELAAIDALERRARSAVGLATP